MRKIFLILILFILCFSNSKAQTINPPTELEAQNELPFYIKVKWNDNSNNETGFRIERAVSLDSSSWDVIGQVGQNIRVFADYWVTLNKKYFYRAYAFNETGISGYTNIDSAIAIGDTTNYPSAPSELRISGITNTSIRINWNDNSNNELGFIIARRGPGEVAYTYIDTVATDVLTFQEVGLTPDNVYFYKVCSYNNTGTSDFTNTVSGITKSNTIVVNNSNVNAGGFFLYNNYPNPFNPSTTIKFGLPENSLVKIIIYNSSGKEVETIVNNKFAKGVYSVNWTSVGLSSGMYFYKIETNKFTETKKMILIK